MTTGIPRPISIALVLARTAVFCLVWVILAGLEPASWIIGAPSVALATCAALRLKEQRAKRPRLAGTIRFLPYFVVESIRGGLDVAFRVMRPALKINPGLYAYPLRLSDLRARVFFLDVVSLLPGTLSADLHNGKLAVHALDIDDDIESSLRTLETRVADLFGEALPSLDLPTGPGDATADSAV